MSTWILLVALGGLVTLDATSGPQIMISRPLVAGALAGLVLGEPVAGALVGGLLEVFHLSVLPIGAARYPEAGAAAVVAATVYVHAATTHHDGPVLLLALVIGLLWGRVGGLSAVWLRHRIDRFAIVDPDDEPTPRAVEGRHLLAIGADFTRGCALVAAGGALAVLLPGVTPATWGGAQPAAFVALTIGSAAALGSGLSIFGGWRDHRVIFLAGSAFGVLLLMVLR